VKTVPRGKPSPKVAITVDPDVYAGVVEEARRQGVSVSAWMTEAARRSLKIQQGLAAVARWEVENGAFTREELEAAERRYQESLALLEEQSE
jgi:post-segregation antitoxin (ccd killing protein)